MKDIDWSKISPEYKYVVLDTQAGHICCCTEAHYGKFKDIYTVLAKRPNPPLTKEQIETVREYSEWLTTAGAWLHDDVVDKWLAQRGGEHE